MVEIDLNYGVTSDEARITFTFDSEVIFNGLFWASWGPCEWCKNMEALTLYKYEDGLGDDHEVFVCGKCREHPYRSFYLP